MARRREQRNDWGTILTRKNARGEVTAYQARYVHPLDASKRVQRNFKPDQKLRAENWLEDEHRLVTAHELGKAVWTHPSEREHAEKQSSVIFADYAQAFLDGYRGADGQVLTPSSLRKKREAIAHLNRYFGGKRLVDIDAKSVNTWLDGGYVDGIHALRRSYQVLKAIMKQASASHDGQPPIIEHNPCTRANPRLPKSQQALIPAAMADELQTIYEHMPDYSRISIYLGAVFGLRISEICALQRHDIDIAHRRLYVRHSIGRGLGDTGALVLKEPKTESSADYQIIPEAFIPILQLHMQAHCAREPDAQLIAPRTTAIMNPNSLRGQFEKARVTADRPDLHFHTLRATAITAAAQQGGTPKEVQRYGRHADAEISLALYQRATEEGSTSLADRVFEALVSPDIRQMERTSATVKAELDQARNALEELEQRCVDLRSHIEALDNELKSHADA
ncbi:site-specific integrase [Bifidobacterium crudilactis]|uniref:site-specific integrase n=1 Tax=Bifidobacterium crudilactis TaxID=327277 RepID=UPI0005519F5D|nr:tyrosine-type recombinase/integrase [Bifidobacterium crudilactis]